MKEIKHTLCYSEKEGYLVYIAYLGKNAMMDIDLRFNKNGQYYFFQDSTSHYEHIVKGNFLPFDDLIKQDPSVVQRFKNKLSKETYKADSKLIDLPDDQFVQKIKERYVPTNKQMMDIYRKRLAALDANPFKLKTKPEKKLQVERDILKNLYKASMQHITQDEKKEQQGLYQTELNENCAEMVTELRTKYAHLFNKYITKCLSAHMTDEQRRDTETYKNYVDSLPQEQGKQEWNTMKDVALKLNEKQQNQ